MLSKTAIALLFELFPDIAALAGSEVWHQAEALVRQSRSNWAPEDIFGAAPEMSASNVFESGMLSLIFTNSNYANVGDATGLRGSSTAGSFYIGLHTSDPGETGSQTTNETSYGSYARQAVARSGSGWTVSGTAPTQAANAAAITFPACTSGTPTITHFSIGSDVSGTGNLFISGALTASLAVSSGITPNFAINALVVTLD